MGGIRDYFLLLCLCLSCMDFSHGAKLETARSSTSTGHSPSISRSRSTSTLGGTLGSKISSSHLSPSKTASHQIRPSSQLSGTSISSGTQSLRRPLSMSSLPSTKPSSGLTTSLSSSSSPASGSSLRRSMSMPNLPTSKATGTSSSMSSSTSMASGPSLRKTISMSNLPSSKTTFGTSSSLSSSLLASGSSLRRSMSMSSLPTSKATSGSSPFTSSSSPTASVSLLRRSVSTPSLPSIKTSSSLTPFSTGPLLRRTASMPSLPAKTSTSPLTSTVLTRPVLSPYTQANRGLQLNSLGRPDSMNKLPQAISGSQATTNTNLSPLLKSAPLSNLQSSNPSSNNLGTSINNRQPSNFKFGMDSSSSPASPPGQNLSPTGSRRNSDGGLTNHMQNLEVNNKPLQLGRIEPWERRVVNNANLQQNCYYCTASGLLDKDTHTMVRDTETMQQNTGTISDTMSLLRQNGYSGARSYDFQNPDQMRQYLDTRVAPGTSQKFGVAYQTNGGGPGHMVGLKVWKNQDGVLGTREIDFQKARHERFPLGPNLNNYTPPGPGPFNLIDLQPQPVQHDKRTAENQLTPEGTSKRARTTGIGL